MENVSLSRIINQWDYYWRCKSQCIKPLFVIFVFQSSFGGIRDWFYLPEHATDYVALKDCLGQWFLNLDPWVVEPSKMGHDNVLTIFHLKHRIKTCRLSVMYSKFNVSHIGSVPDETAQLRCFKFNATTESYCTLTFLFSPTYAK